MAFMPKVFIIDVDGVMTDGKIYQTVDGKFFKVFGPDDHDALSMIKEHLAIHFVTGDKRGFEITKARIVAAMNMPLDLVSTIRRINWIEERWKAEDVIYMGDGIFDHYVFNKVGYSISTSDGDSYTKSKANYVTSRKGGDRAVAEACIHILNKFFNAYNPEKLPGGNTKLSGEWSI